MRVLQSCSSNFTVDLFQSTQLSFTTATTTTTTTTSTNDYTTNTATPTTFVILQLLLSPPLPQLFATSAVSLYTNMSYNNKHNTPLYKYVI